ncbi:MAG: DUF2202 domain-containing protein [Candidatus Sericytochromatia bacterium]
MKSLLISIASLILISACNGNQINNKASDLNKNNDFYFGQGASYLRYGNGGFGFRNGNGNQNSGMMNKGKGMLGQGYSNDYLKTTLDTITITDLKGTEKDDLLYMIEEEKMAKDVYVALYDKWKVRSFQNISQSEQFHVDAVKLLLDRHKIENPIDSKAGVFKNSKIQDLYNKLIADGNESLEKALLVGAKIEEVDIKDLSDRMSENTSEDIQVVFDALMSASENHLRAFVSNYKNFFSKDYSPVFLSSDDYKKIVSN